MGNKPKTEQITTISELYFPFQILSLLAMRWLLGKHKKWNLKEVGQAQEDGLQPTAFAIVGY